MRATKVNMEPCCENQKPSLYPPILIVFRISTKMILNPKDTVNHTIRHLKISDIFSVQ